MQAAPGHDSSGAAYKGEAQNREMAHIGEVGYDPDGGAVRRMHASWQQMTH
jgi:hypothetical protein